MREDWIECTLGDFIQHKGQSLNPKNHLDETLELYSVPNHAIKKPEIKFGKDIGSSKQVVGNNWVLLSRINPHLNRSWVIKSDSDLTKIASSEWVKFPPNDALNPEFIGFFLTKTELKNYMCLNVSGVGGSLTRTNKNAISIFKLPLPPIVEQKAIVKKIEELFSSLDSGIADLKKAQDQLVIYRQAVLKKAFEGDYTQLNAEKEKIVLNGLQSSIPQNWKICKIGEIAKLQGGFAFKSAEFTDSGIPIVKIKNVHYQDIDWSDKSFVASSRLEEFNSYSLNKGDVLIAMTRPVIKSLNNIKTVVVKESDLPALLNQRVGRFVINGEVDKNFLKYYIFTDFFKRRVLKESSSSQQPNISSTKIEKFDFVLPETIKEQHQIVQEIESRLSICDKVEKDLTDSLEKAQALRQSILKKAFEGKLLSEEEIAKCKEDAAYEPASVLLEKIKEEKKKK